MTFLGIAGMIDPLRPGADAAIETARKAGIDVSMVTGDHLETALAIARELGLASDPSEVVTGSELEQIPSRPRTESFLRGNPSGDPR